MRLIGDKLDGATICGRDDEKIGTVSKGGIPRVLGSPSASLSSPGGG
ncbi:hypothetical protein J2X65_004135 [Ancylobacter sp. 3268]|nr:hypothetical protein [Ancylobacter sp. 3268]